MKASESKPEEHTCERCGRRFVLGPGSEWNAHYCSDECGFAADIAVENHGSIILIRSLSARAATWLRENLEPGTQYFGNAACIEPRYLGDIIEGMRNDGMGVAA